MKITGEQCRAARALLDWKVTDLMDKASVDKKTVQRKEQGRELRPKVEGRIVKAFFDNGIEFIDGEEGRYLPTAAIKPGFQPVFPKSGKAAGRKLTANARIEMVQHWRSHPESWAELSDEGRDELLDEMGMDEESELFGDDVIEQSHTPDSAP